MAAGSRWWVWVLCGGLVCWAIGFWWYWSRASLWILDLVVSPVMAALYVGGLGAVAVALLERRLWLVVAIVLPVLLAVTVVVNAMWIVAPRTWFMIHRPLFERALETDPGSDYYGNQLPWALRFLTEGGSVSNEGGSHFFPQWIGIPDDAGGYLYNPTESPGGADLYGVTCTNPVDLGDGWWMCGLRKNGF